MISRSELFAFARNTVLRAGAGTGKTEALATLFLHLMAGLSDPEVWPKQGVAPERVVALTFTEKAASEMRERIAEAVEILSVDTLPDGLSSPDGRVREAAARRWGQARELGPAVIARVLALAESASALGRPLPPMSTWKQIALGLGRARIGTFHSFAASVLHAEALELDLDPQFKVMQQEDADELLHDCVLDTLSDHARESPEAVGELMSLAGGDESDVERSPIGVLSNIVRQMDESGVEDGVTYSQGVARETGSMDLVEACLRLESFASACESISSLEEEGFPARIRALIEHVRSVSSLPPRARAEQLLGLVGSTAMPGRNRTRRIEESSERAREALMSLRSDAVSTLSQSLSASVLRTVREARRRFRRAKRARGALDFGDLMRQLRDALATRPALRTSLHARLDAVLVDEFQDTNRVQRDLLYLMRLRREQSTRLFARQESPHAVDLAPSGLLLVGDAKQSIYAFRGADVGVFLETERELAAAGGSRLALTDSHRSLEEVVDAVNPTSEALLGHGLIAHGESMYDRTRDMLVAEQRGDGRARAELLLVKHGRADDVRKREAEAIARRILALVNGELASTSGAWQRARFDDIAVLVPSWSHLEPFRRAFKTHGIPYVLLGGPGFWEQQEVDDLIVLLRLVADPSNRLALAAVLRGPLVGLSDAGLAHVMLRATSVEMVLDPPPSLRDDLSSEDQERLDETRPMLRRLLRAGVSMRPSEVLRLALDERSFASVLATQPFGAQKVANVDKLVALALAAEHRDADAADIHGFVRHVDRMRSADQHETEADVAEIAHGAVSILSIHAAKGLEWPVVFVAQTSRRRRNHAERVLLREGREVIALPAGCPAPESFREQRRDAHAAEDDDQRRLLYVALTRARDLVVVSGPTAEGDGEWITLSQSFARQAPQRVRVLDANLPEEFPCVPVRAMGVQTDDDAAAQQRANEADWKQQLVAATARKHDVRHEVVTLTTLAEFSICPRRYLALQEFGASALERTNTLAVTRESQGVLRDLFARTFASEGAEVFLSRVAAARNAWNDDDGTRAQLNDACTRLEAFARSALYPVLAANLVRLQLPVSMAREQSGRGAAWSDTIDLLLDDSPYVANGVCLARVAVGSSHGRGAGLLIEPLDVHAFRLQQWRAAFQLRMREAQHAVNVRTAVLVLGHQDARLFHLETSAQTHRAQGVLSVVEVAEELERSQREQRWQGQDRTRCEHLRCALVSMCHPG